MYLTIIILPLLASIVSGFFGRKIGVSGSQTITCTAVIMTTGFALLAFFEVGLNNIPVAIELFRWIDSESLYVSWLFYYDSLTVSMLIPVLIVSSLVHIYSIGYMSHDPHIQRFFSYLSLFTFMMLILVTADNYLLMFVGWEGVGVCSYLLVAFWPSRIAANQSSLSAFLTNRVGDCFLTVGMFAILFAFGNLDYATVFSLAPYMHENVLTIVGICLVIGAAAKSSQVGLHVWLPMAMEGPTPVSALIHAATMVTAGVYLLMRSSPLIEYSSIVLMICLWLGAITTVFSSLIGLYQQDIKKVIAYSTMSQLGMMVIAVGLSSYGIALFHLVNHAFYKALLFLGAGAVIHAVADNQDFRRYGGLRPFLPLTYSVMLIASLSLVAFPFMTGFYSKDFILESAFGKYYFSATVVYIIATIGAMFTTLYSVKVLYLTFLTNPNGPLINYKNAHEGDIFMSSPLMILAVFSIFFGFVTKDMFIGLGSGFFSDNALFIHPIHEIMLDTEFAVATLFKLLPLMFTISLSVIAIILSEFLSTTLISFKLSRTGYNIFSFFNQRFLIELFYNRFFSGTVLKLGGQTTKVLDKGSVEYIGPYGLEKGLLNISSNISNLNTGSVTTYALFITTGVVLYILSFSYVSIHIGILTILLALILVLFNSKPPVDAILKSSMVGDTFMTLTQISGRSLREVVAGVCANEGHITAISQCSHGTLSVITPTALEISRGQVPDCDTGLTGIDTRHTSLNGSNSFYTCSKCFGVWCRNCKFLDMLPFMLAAPGSGITYGDRLSIRELTKAIYLNPTLAASMIIMQAVDCYIYCVVFCLSKAIACVEYLVTQATRCVSYVNTHKKFFITLLFVIVATVIIAVYSATIFDGLYAFSTLLYSSDIVSDGLSNTEYFFSPSMTMLKTLDGISEEERLVGDYENCAGPTDHATGEQVFPGYEGDHTFGRETPENFTATNDDGTTNPMEGMCEGCEQSIDYATQTYQSCSDCAREWCQTCVTLIESML